jgi:hypothetical protein
MQAKMNAAAGAPELETMGDHVRSGFRTTAPYSGGGGVVPSGAGGGAAMAPYQPPNYAQQFRPPTLLDMGNQMAMGRAAPMMNFNPQNMYNELNQAFAQQGLANQYYSQQNRLIDAIMGSMGGGGKGGGRRMPRAKSRIGVPPVNRKKPVARTRSALTKKR